MTGTIEHEIIHYIEEILNNPKTVKFSGRKKGNYDFAGTGNYTYNQEENYYDSNVELKTQILNVYRSLTSWYKHFNMTYDDLLRIEYDPFVFVKIFTPFVETAFNEKRNIIRIKTLLNLLYKNKRLIKDPREEKKFIKKFNSILKKKYKNTKKWDREDKLYRTKLRTMKEKFK